MKECSLYVYICEFYPYRRLYNLVDTNFIFYQKQNTDKYILTLMYVSMLT